MEPAGEEEQDGVSAHSPSQAPPSSATSLSKNQDLPQVELELRVLEALETYPILKLKGVHRHFVLYGLMESLHRSFNRHFSADEVLQLLDRFFNLEMLKPDDEEISKKLYFPALGFSFVQVFTLWVQMQKRAPVLQQKAIYIVNASYVHDGMFLPFSVGTSCGLFKKYLQEFSQEMYYRKGHRPY
ncbi:hypothetical protein J5N97_010238 [Dioscorea zingiberensis]|uniref:Uncharacterized protein n=1 Tax=Dioscorea zingiberensis TaxID=325984 RepID=A0A9D5D0W0_9LILI|nr:hypothetical protein J5N97_010238 [Dioscorea zingiberensis]